jgi:predicted Zn-dependent protease
MAQMAHMIEGPSTVDAGMTEFKECLQHMRDGHPEDALGHARRALGAAPKNPFYLSYTGLLAAMADRRYADAETLCREALNLKCNHAQLYLNLAEVYTQAGRSSDAIDVLEKGMVSAGRDFRIRRALERIGVRRGPVLSFLHRSNPINVMLGRLRYRFAGPARCC